MSNPFGEPGAPQAAAGQTPYTGYQQPQQQQQPQQPQQQQQQQHVQQQQQPQQQASQQQQHGRGAPPPPPSSAQNAAKKDWQGNFGSDQIRANVTASIMKEQSIVVPTMSDSMLQEFNKRNIERMQRMKVGTTEEKAAAAPAPAPAPAATSNPFDQVEASAPTSITEALPQYGTPQQQQQPAPAARNRVEEDPQLLGITIGFLRRHYDHAMQTGAQPATVQELEDHIRAITGFGWPTYWQSVHGPVLDFTLRHPECLALIDNHFVVLREHEADARARFASSWTTMPLNMMQQQQHQQQPQMQHPPMDTYGGQGGYSHQEQPQPDYSAYYQQQQPPAAYEGNPYGYDTNQNPYGAAPGYGQQQQHQPSTYASGYQQQPDYGASRPMSQQMSAPPVNGGLDDGWVLFDNDSDLNAPIANPFGTPAFGDDLPWASSGYGAEDPLAVFNTADSADAAAIREEEERKAARKAKRKEDRRKKKEQESEDEKLARRLQEEEDARAAAAASRSAQSSNPRASTGGSALTSSRVNSGAVSTNRVALTHVEVRELAEEEIGKDNIRILAGFSVTKFGREGRPHQRKMWINSALTHLAWESSQYDGSHRGLELKQVVGIRIGEMTPTIRRSTKDARKVRSLCFSLETQARTLDLQACSVIQRDALAAALKKAVEFNQRHKPRRVDKYRTELFI